MPIDVLNFPHALQPQAVTFTRGGPSSTGPVTGERPVQQVRGFPGHWVGNYDAILLRKAQFDEVLVWRGLAARDWREKPVWLVPVHDCPRSPRTTAGIAPATCVPFTDSATSANSTFSDGTTFAARAEDFHIAAAAPRGATVLRISQLWTPALWPGHYFSVKTRTDGWRLHTVAATFPVAGSATQHDLQIWPPLRAAVAVGDLIESEAPRVPVTLQGDLGAVIRYGVSALKGFSFAEAPW